jgi:hypothetical protein
MNFLNAYFGSFSCINAYSFKGLLGHKNLVPIHNCFHLHAYKVHIVEALKPDDKPHHSQFAKDILSNVEADENYLQRWIFRDEATFYISGRVNRYSCRIWGLENLHTIQKI